MQWKSRNIPYVPYNDSYRWELVKQTNNTLSQAPVGAEQFGISRGLPSTNKYLEVVVSLAVG